MTTELARQLLKLKVPGQPSIREATSKRKPSLLFDGKHAADIEVDTIYALGVNGLEELTSLEPNFAEFESSLFSESCKSFERTVQTKDVLQELDATIARFLRQLSPFLLLKPAHKCLELLIRVYRIQSCNVNHVLECILPYYETNLFARMVQLLHLQSHSNPSWQWLKPIQKEGTPLSRATLVQHCISDPAFLSFVCEMVPSSIKAGSGVENKVVVSFYCSTLTSVLGQADITESITSRILPYVVKGLKSSCGDYKAASYIVVSMLASRVVLQKKVSNSLLNVIAKVRNTCTC